MAKKKSRFFLGMVIYALVFLMITAAGLFMFWKYMEAYELSRPLTAVNAYLDGLTKEHIRAGSESLLTSVDGNIQTADQAFAVIEENLVKQITAARNSKQSTAEKMVYALRSGSRIIGSVTIVPGGDEQFGFTPWKVQEDTFDFSWLLSEDISITVPSEFSVSLNGNILNESYISESGILYPVLEDFSDKFEMPTLVTYTARQFLGELSFVVSDVSGNPVLLTSDTDLNQFLPQCSEEEYVQLQKLVLDYLNRYIAYSSSANHDAPGNYAWLNQMLIPGSELSKRLGTALDGLQYVQNLRDKIVSTEVNGIYKLSEERYLCDISYVLEVLGRKGVVELEHNMKVVFLQTRYGLRVEAMTQY